MTSGGTSLIVVKDQLIEAHFGDLDEAKPIGSRSPSSSEVVAYARGEIAGNEANLDKQIEETVKTKRID